METTGEMGARERTRQIAKISEVVEAACTTAGAPVIAILNEMPQDEINRAFALVARMRIREDDLERFGAFSVLLFEASLDEPDLDEDTVESDIEMRYEVRDQIVSLTREVLELRASLGHLFARHGVLLSWPNPP